MYTFNFNFLVLIVSCLYCASAEDFISSTAHLERLFETQAAIISELPSYIKAVKLRLAYLENQTEIFQKDLENALKDVSNYMENPLNAFKVIKRISHDLRSVEESPDSDSDFIRYIKTTSPQLLIPSRVDLEEAAVALVRLQNTYKLNVTELADGRLKDEYSDPMTSEDCFVIGRIISQREKGNECASALPWLLEALRKHRQGDDGGGQLSQIRIIKFISYCYFKLGDVKSAVDWSLDILALDRDNSQIKNIYAYFIQVFAEKDKTHETEEVVSNATARARGIHSYNVGKYEALCRGELQLNADITKRLFCWYSSKNHPFLKLAPIKVEQVHIEPDVFVFHQVISDQEIQEIKDIANPGFKRAEVSQEDRTPAKFRICKTSWLSDSISATVARITQRIADMTGLSMVSAESLQVANYGIGGHYLPHHDSSNLNMSEVAQGGATVFTELGLSVFPIKNAALYWLNLHPSGGANRLTMHAACPVLRGSKWVCNKWIHQSGQELIKPCNLEFQQEVPDT